MKLYIQSELDSLDLIYKYIILKGANISVLDKSILASFIELHLRHLTLFSLQSHQPFFDLGIFLETFPTYHASKKPAIPVRRHHSADLKWRVIHQAYTLHKRSKHISTDLYMPL